MGHPASKSNPFLRQPRSQTNSGRSSVAKRSSVIPVSSWLSSRDSYPQQSSKDFSRNSSVERKKQTIYQSPKQQSPSRYQTPNVVKIKRYYAVLAKRLNSRNVADSVVPKKLALQDETVQKLINNDSLVYETSFKHLLADY